MTAPGVRIFDPLANEYAAPIPAVLPMTGDTAGAALFDSEPAAIRRSRQLIGSTRPWLVMQPVCALREGAC